jgi:ferredoxin-nitrite reductase
VSGILKDICLNRDEVVRIHVSGCSASCARIQIADIALRGTVKRTLEGCQGAVDVGIGGSIENGRFIKWIIPSLPISELPKVIENILRIYLSYRKERESFGDFCARVGVEEIRRILAGGEVGIPIGHKG